MGVSSVWVLILRLRSVNFFQEERSGRHVDQRGRQTMIGSHVGNGMLEFVLFVCGASTGS